MTNNVGESGNRGDKRIDGKGNKAAVLAMHSAFSVAKAEEKRYGYIHQGYRTAYRGEGRERGAKGRGMAWAGSSSKATGAATPAKPDEDQEWCGELGRPHAAESPGEVAQPQKKRKKKTGKCKAATTKPSVSRDHAAPVAHDTSTGSKRQRRKQAPAERQAAAASPRRAKASGVRGLGTGQSHGYCHPHIRHHPNPTPQPTLCRPA